MGFISDILKEAEEKKKMEEKKKRQKKIKEVLLTILALGGIVAFLFIADYFGWGSKEDDTTSDELEIKGDDTTSDELEMRDPSSYSLTELIEQRNYVEARKKIKSSYMLGPEELELVSKAQVADLVFEGNFDLAAQIANEDVGSYGHTLYYKVYYECVFDNLVKIYTEQGEDKLLYALSTISYPVNGEDNGYIKYSNGRLESFCDYLNVSDKKDLIPKVLAFLRAEYKQDGWESDGQNKKYREDFSDQKRIKAKFGIK